MKSNNFFALLAIFILIAVLFRDCGKTTEKTVYVPVPQYHDRSGEITPRHLSAPVISNDGEHETKPHHYCGKSHRVQCMGTTVSGLRCRNKTRNACGYCWVHEK